MDGILGQQEGEEGGSSLLSMLDVIFVTELLRNP